MHDMLSALSLGQELQLRKGGANGTTLSSNGYHRQRSGLALYPDILNDLDDLFAAQEQRRNCKD